MKRMQARLWLPAAALLMAATAHAGSHSGQSASFRVDTRAATSVKVTGVSSRWCDGAYGGAGRHVYFLAGVALDVAFTAQVAWGGRTGSRLEFNGVNNGLNYARSLNVGGLPVGGKLELVAVATDGTRSPPFRANFDVAPKPPVFGNFLHAEAPLPFSNDLTYSTPSVDFTPIDALSGSLQLGKSVPFLSNEEMKIAPSIKMSVKVNGSAGTMTVKPEVGAKGDVKINGTQARKPNGTFGKTALFDLALYVEGEIISAYDQLSGEWIISEAWLGLDVNAQYKTPPAYYLVFYGQLEFGVNAAFTYRLYSVSRSGDIGGDFRFSSEALPKIQLVAGVGLSSFAALEAYGGLYGVLDVRGTPVVWNKVGIKGRIGARGVLIGWASAEWDIWSGTYWIIDPANPLAMLALPSETLPMKLTNLDTRQFRPLGRDYLERGALLPLAAMPESRIVALTGGSETTLVTDGYPYPDPAVAAAGMTNHVLYVRDNAGRLAENRTELVHVYNGGEGWSAPVAVWDDGTGDFAPQAAALPNGTLLAVWANGRAALTNGASLNEALVGLEIAVGECDPATGLWTCRNLTSNAYLDHSPMLAAAADGTAIAAWIRNRQNNPSGTPQEPNRLLFSRFTGGGWEEEDYIAVNLGTITYCDLAYNGTVAALVFAMDLDGDLETRGDQELYGSLFNGSQWGPYVRMTDNAVQDTRPYVRYRADGTLLTVWFQAGKVMSAEGLALANAAVCGEIGVASGAQDFKLVTGPDGQLAVVWQDAGAEGVVAPDPYIMNYDPVQGLWSRGVRLLEDPALQRGFSGAFGADGRLRLAYAKVAVGEDAEGVPVFGAVDLCVLDHPVGPDPAISQYGITLSTNAAEFGESVDVRVTVENRGDLPVTNLAVCVYEGDPAAGGALLGATQRVARILGGTSEVVNVAWTLPEAASNVVLHAVVDPGLETDDRNRANNTATLAALMPDLSVNGALTLNETTNMRLISAAVMNEGAVPVPAGTQVTFRRGASDGALLAEDTLGAIVFGTNGVYDAGFRWDMAGLTFTSAFEIVYIAVDPTNGVSEIEERNNTAAVQVMTSLDSDGDGLLDGEEQRLGTRTDLADSDGDGLSDYDEVHTHLCNPLLADSDGDGADDAHEIAAGTDPNSASDLFTIVAADGTETAGMRVRWNAKAGKTYQVECAPVLAGPWDDAPDGEGEDGASLRTAVADGVLTYLDTTAPVPATRFYRVRIVTP